MYRGFVYSKVLMVRMLVLVIASDSPAHYVEMQKVWVRRCTSSVGGEGGVRCASSVGGEGGSVGETSLEPGSQSAYAERIKMDADVWKMRPLGTHLSKCLCQAPSEGGSSKELYSDTMDFWFVKAKPERLWVGDIANDGPLSDTVEFDRDAMTIYVKGDETFIPGILNKTVEAIRAIGLEYDFVWRTNLSSVLDFDGLLRYCRVQTSHLNLSGGLSAKQPEGPSEEGLMSHPPVASLKDGQLRCVFYAGYTGLADVATNKDIDSNIRFASGSGFLLSREAVQYLIENDGLLRRDLIDDVAIGALLEPRFGIVHLDRCRIKTGEENVSHVVSQGVFHFRCETYCHERTVEFMNKVDRALLR